MDRKVHAGFIERVPAPEDLDKSELPKIIRAQLEEMKEEIDALWARHGDDLRAAQPWESDQEWRRLDALKTKLSQLMKGN